MPEREKITREKIADAGFMLVREEGESRLNVRNLAARLGCSTQPIMYCYKSVNELREDILNKADAFQTEYLSKNINGVTDIMLGIGLNYIKFAAEERNLFRFIFLSERTQGAGIAELISGDDSGELLLPIIQNEGLSAGDAKNVFEAFFAAFHGYATMIAYNMIQYDKRHCYAQLTRTYYGIIDSIKYENAKNSSTVF